MSIESSRRNFLVASLTLPAAGMATIPTVSTSSEQGEQQWFTKGALFSSLALLR
jgi:hypothetical protein